MKIGIAERDWPTSFQVYQENVCTHLMNMAADFQTFPIRSGKIPDDFSLVWTQGAPILDTWGVLRSVSCPIVTTIHGVDQFFLPMKCLETNFWKRCRWQVKKPIQRSFWHIFGRKIDAIITVSEYAKECVEQVYGLHPAKTHRIYHGFDANLFHPQVSPYIHKAPYLLHVSSGRKKKNIPRLIRAFRSIESDIEADLLIVAPEFEGSVGDTERILFMARNGPVEQDQLARLYSGAIAFIFPSFDETFGLPLLEAMACGCPVVTSDRSACPEVAGKGGILVDPFSEKKIADAMYRLAVDSQLRNKLMRYSLEQAKQFSWGKSAQKHYEVFKSVLRCWEEKQWLSGGR